MTPETPQPKKNWSSLYLFMLLIAVIFIFMYFDGIANGQVIDQSELWKPGDENPMLQLEKRLKYNKEFKGTDEEIENLSYMYGKLETIDEHIKQLCGN